MPPDNVFRLPACACPTCGKPFNAAGHLEPHQAGPKSGDFSVCLSCATVLIFTDDLRTRRMSEEERSQLSDEQRDSIRQAVRTVRQWNASRN